MMCSVMVDAQGGTDNNKSAFELQRRLEQIEQAGLKRVLRSVGKRCSTHITMAHRECLQMASNDYLGLSQHPKMISAMAQALKKTGAGSGASRLISGTLDRHGELERTIAWFKKTEAALFFPTGYMANLAVISGLTQTGDLILSDELNHASIIDACRLSKAQVMVYRHGDVQHAASLLAKRKWHVKLIVTDGVFSMDGDIAPLADLMELAQNAGAMLVIDDAHATGVWGKSGRGSVEHFGIEPNPNLVMVGTFSKALGSMGGFVAASRIVIDTLINRSRPFLYSTAPPPVQVAGAIKGIELVDEEPWIRDKLIRLANRLRVNLQQMGFRVLSSSGAIIPVLVGDLRRTMTLSNELLARGVFVPAIRPPTVAPGCCRLRFTVSAAHTDDDINFVTNALCSTMEEASPGEQ